MLPLIDTMKKCMLQPIRTEAGLGNPPNKWVNNRTENLHEVIKEKLNYASFDACTSLERVRDTVFWQQTDESIRGIFEADVDAAFTVQVGFSHSSKCHCHQHIGTDGLCCYSRGGNNANKIVQYNLPRRFCG